MIDVSSSRPRAIPCESRVQTSVLSTQHGPFFALRIPKRI